MMCPQLTCKGFLESPDEGKVIICDRCTTKWMNSDEIAAEDEIPEFGEGKEKSGVRWGFYVTHPFKYTLMRTQLVNIVNGPSSAKEFEITVIDSEDPIVLVPGRVYELYVRVLDKGEYLEEDDEG